jgi:hypothetical protein
VKQEVHHPVLDHPSAQPDDAMASTSDFVKKLYKYVVALAGVCVSEADRHLIGCSMIPPSILSSLGALPAIVSSSRT